LGIFRHGITRLLSFIAGVSWSALMADDEVTLSS
jgi:hypothetical protein